MKICIRWTGCPRFVAHLLRHLSRGAQRCHHHSGVNLYARLNSTIKNNETMDRTKCADSSAATINFDE